jgi:predicted TIM-barrel fold metal-dependent hydrolase
MLIDMHTHLWKGEYAKNKLSLLAAAEAYNIDEIYVSSLGSLYPDKDEIQESNKATYEFMQEQPKLIRGYCYINPTLNNCMDTLKLGIEEQHMSAMKLWVATFCDDPKVFPLIEKCIEYDIPILAHAFYKAVDQLEYESLGVNVAHLARRYPEAKIIMAHMGANCYSQIKQIRELKNVSVDISGSLYRRDEVDYVKKAIGSERILFGTDMPGANFLVNLGQIEEAALTAEEKENIYYKNAKKIFRRTR